MEIKDIVQIISDCNNPPIWINYVETKQRFHTYKKELLNNKMLCNSTANCIGVYNMNGQTVLYIEATKPKN